MKQNAGQKIIMSGFKSIDDSAMAILNKMIATHAKRIGHLAKNLDNVHITLKEVHQREKSEKYEVHAKVVDGGRVFVSEVTERNLLAAVDNALSKVTSEMD
ncbi:HPF/RaiA family ribosome-associated protein [Candidatus Woesearchaeota archaeon]|nr:HPF/RaiA family ribosome-associated protein [Candidatus Woesearchaeota archaeon]